MPSSLSTAIATLLVHHEGSESSGLSLASSPDILLRAAIATFTLVIADATSVWPSS